MHAGFLIVAPRNKCPNIDIGQQNNYANEELDGRKPVGLNGR